MTLFVVKTLYLILCGIISTCIALRYECDQQNVSCGCGFKNVDIKDGMFQLEEAIPHSWSMIVSIQYDCQKKNQPSTHCCTGTILNDRYVLTSASCFDRKSNETNLADDVTIVSAIHSLNQQCSIKNKVESIQLHPESITGRKYGHDLALIRLAARLDFTSDFLLSRVCPITPSENNTMNPSMNSTWAVVGWNISDDMDAEKSQTLRQMAFNPNGHGTRDHLWYLRWPTAHCYHENGSALFTWLGNRWELIGIQSMAMNICSSNDNHGLFTPLSNFSTWIHSVINSDQSTKASTTTRLTTTARPSLIYSCNRSFSCGCGYSNVRFNLEDVNELQYAASNSWSMVLSVRNKTSGEHLCTGTILSPSFVLTTAQCVQNLLTANLSVFAGATNLSDTMGTRRDVKNITIHPNYAFSSNSINNIALLQLNRPLTFKDNPILNRICVENSNKSLSLNELTPANGSRIVAVCWESLQSINTNQSSLGLKQIHLYVEDHRNSECGISGNSTLNQFCAGHSSMAATDTCLNDRGLAIFNWNGHYWQQVGIFGHPLIRNQSGLPNAFTRLSSYWPWIEKIVNNANETLDTATLVLPTTTTTVSTIRTTRTTSTGIPTNLNGSNATTTGFPSNMSTTSSSWSPSNSTQTNHNANSSITTIVSWMSTNSSQAMGNTSSASITWSTSTRIINNVTTNNTTNTPTGSNGSQSTSTSSRTPMATITTTITKPSETWYVCNRLPDQCGCSMNDVIRTDGHEESENVRPRSWSMIVSIRLNGVQHLCSGTILSEFYILASARCVSNLLADTKLSIAAGVDDLWDDTASIRSVDEIFIHENYNGNVSSMNDIAILKLSTALDINRRPSFSISKICLPSNRTVGSKMNNILMTVGWNHSSFFF